MKKAPLILKATTPQRHNHKDNLMPKSSGVPTIRAQMFGGPLDGEHIAIRCNHFGSLKCHLAIERSEGPTDHFSDTYALVDANNDARTIPRIAIYWQPKPNVFQFVRMGHA